MHASNAIRIKIDRTDLNGITNWNDMKNVWNHIANLSVIYVKILFYSVIIFAHLKLGVKKYSILFLIHTPCTPSNMLS